MTDRIAPKYTVDATGARLRDADATPARLMQQPGAEVVAEMARRQTAHGTRDVW